MNHDDITGEDYQADADVDLQPQTIRTPRELLRESLQTLAHDACGDGKNRDAEREQLAGGSLYDRMTLGGGR